MPMHVRRPHGMAWQRKQRGAGSAASRRRRAAVARHVVDGCSSGGRELGRSGIGMEMRMARRMGIGNWEFGGCWAVGYCTNVARYVDRRKRLQAIWNDRQSAQQ
jgi:hypothetical protein